MTTTTKQIPTVQLVSTAQFSFDVFRLQLNREIAQNIYNRALVDDNDDDGGSSSGGGTIEGSDKLQWNAVGKKDLVRRIHMKNDHIKRLMCEYDVLHDENKRMKQELLTLNVTVKQLNRQLNESNAELNEQNELNRQSNEAIVILQKEVNAVRSRMSRIEGDKRKYKKEILALGHEIEAKMKIWNKLLEERHEKVATETRDSFADEIEPRESSQSRRLEVDALSRAVAKRNMIIVEMEILLTELTREIAESAGVINRIVNDLAQRESKFVGHLEKLQKQLTRIANHSIEKTSNSNETVKNPSPKSGKKKRSNEKIFSKILKKPGAKGAQFA